jgi:hypothetical protein
VPKRRQQGFVHGRFERDDFGDAKSLLHILGIESLNVADALLKPLDPAPLLFDGKDRCFGLGTEGLGRRGDLSACCSYAERDDRSGMGFKSMFVFGRGGDSTDWPYVTVTKWRQ